MSTLTQKIIQWCVSGCKCARLCVDRLPVEKMLLLLLEVIKIAAHIGIIRGKFLRMLRVLVGLDADPRIETIICAHLKMIVESLSPDSIFQKSLSNISISK